MTHRRPRRHQITQLLNPEGILVLQTICPRYNSGESELKKEIPVKVTQEKSVAGKQPSANPTDFSFSRPSKKFISKDRRICDVCGAAVSRKGLEQHYEPHIVLSGSSICVNSTT